MAVGKCRWLDKAEFAISLGALALTVLGATSANAADLAGKWYGKLDAEPVISINKAGSEYSASLDYADRIGQIVQGSRVFDASSHKSLVSLKAAGGNVRFSIGTATTVYGDINYEKDEYNLNLSADGRQMTGTVNHVVDEESTDPLRMVRAPITLFLGE